MIPRARTLLPILLLLPVAGLTPLGAEELRVLPQDGPEALRQAIQTAEPGDVVRVVGGRWTGPLVVDRGIRLLGEGWPVVDGEGRGTVIRIRGHDVHLEGFVIRGSGSSLDEENSGVAVEAPRVTVQGNRLEQVLFGIYLRKAADSVILDNRIRGMDLDIPRRGDAIRVWYSDGVEIRDNVVRDARDVVLWYSSDLSVHGNRVQDGRYGLHFMYCDDAQIRQNILLRNSVGAFLMYSRRLRLESNAIAGNQGPSGYGVGLKDMDDAEIVDNLFVGNRVGIFLDNSPRDVRSVSRIEANLLAANDIGVKLLPNVRRSTFRSNSFLENREQVAIAGGGGDPEANSWQSNHWSDYRGYDADDDGFGDVPYRSDRLFESLMDRNAELRLFSWSPVVQAVDFAARAFPLVKPDPKLTDPVPRMEPQVPEGPPRLGGPDGRGLLSAGVGLAALALLLLAGPGLALSGAATMRRMRDGSTERAPHRPRAVDESPLVELRAVGKRFGDTVALEDVSFAVKPGEAVALWGPNGAGKTTALRSLLGVMPHDGEVVIGGFESRRQGKKARRLLGFVPQESSFPDLRAREVAELFARLHRVSLDRVSELFRTLGLEGEEEKQVANLSGGRKQRLALAVALLSDPPLLVLDEPTASLDVDARREFLDLLLELKAGGKTIVFSSHRPDEVRILADRVLRLEEGRLVGSEAPSVVSGEGPEVELELALGRDDLDRAAQLLEDRGFAPRHRSGGLLLRVPANGKIDPIALLLRHEIDLKDFRTEEIDAEPA